MALQAMERKARLEHGQQAAIADALGVSRQLVSTVMADAYLPRTAKGRMTLRRVQAAIADALGVSVDEAFGPAAAPAADDEQAPPRAA